MRVAEAVDLVYNTRHTYISYMLSIGITPEPGADHCELDVAASVADHGPGPGTWRSAAPTIFADARAALVKPKKSPKERVAGRLVT